MKGQIIDLLIHNVTVEEIRIVQKVIREHRKKCQSTS